MPTRSFIVRTTILVSLAASVWIGGCGPTRKVQRTLALNDLSLRARTAEKEGDDALALELWQEYVERRPHAHFAEYQLGRTEARMGMYTEAIGHLTTAHDLRPGEAEYIETLADTYILAGRIDEMMTLLHETANEGELGSGHLRLARYAQRVGLLDDAKLAIRSAMIYAGEESAEPYMAMADFGKQIGDKELEEQALRRALWFDRSSSDLDARFLAIGVTPGPSLAVDPATPMK